MPIFCGILSLRNKPFHNFIDFFWHNLYFIKYHVSKKANARMCHINKLNFSLVLY
ncbi:hypothetical protein C1645_773429 [Glomus cerebriforme]|uniref:Uncharacterized protein n=1 Tax=Glomus cerebriforme TaxID=658196 RepID=A0A397SYJ4_9GLOM|nr:hypothetical protein C1645_773429 [Glomus cerebriforme]